MSRRSFGVTLVMALLLVLVPASTLAWMTPDNFIPCSRAGVAVTDSGVKFYRVTRGDTLWSIARTRGMDVETLMAMNNLSKDCIILEGQLLKVPYWRNRLHQVRVGETVWQIAAMYQVNADDILRVNSIKRPEQLKVGKLLRIPSQSYVYRSRQPARSIVLASFHWPLFGTITSRFGPRHRGFHHGVDIAAKQGSYIRAADSGQVIFTGWKRIYGRTVIVKHSGNKKTLYAHASKILVKKGQRVKRGQAIARVGSTGRTTGPHLHFEVYIGEKCKNPLNYLR